MIAVPRFEETENEVRKEGGPRTLCEVVKNLMKSTKWTAEQAMEALSIPAAKQKELKAKL